MNNKLFKKGDEVVCIDPPDFHMYENKVDKLIYGKLYKIKSYEIYTTLVNLEKWNGFSGADINCNFYENRFILRSNLTEEMKFKIIKYKLGIKED